MNKHEMLPKTPETENGEKATAEKGTPARLPAIARSYGGGGHKGAAGFVCAELPFAPMETIGDKK